MDCQWGKGNKQRYFLVSQDCFSLKKYELLSKKLLWVADKTRALKKKIEDKEAGIAERLEGNDRVKESGDSQADNSCASLCKEKIDYADQLVVPPWNNSDSVGSEVLKDLFQRFGSVKVSCNTFCQTINPLKTDC